MGGILEGIGAAIEGIADAIGTSAAADTGVAAGAGEGAAAGTAAATAGTAAASTIPEVVVTGSLPSAGTLAAAGAGAGGAAELASAALNTGVPGATPTATIPGAVTPTIPGATPTTPLSTPGGPTAATTATNLANTPIAGGAGGGGLGGSGIPALTGPNGISSDLTSLVSNPISDTTTAPIPGISSDTSLVPGGGTAFNPGVEGTLPTSPGVIPGVSTPGVTTVGAAPGVGSNAISSVINSIGGAGTSTPSGVASTLSEIGSIGGPAVAGGGLLYNLLQGNPNKGATNQLQATAGNLSAQSAQLESYLNTGTLPPGAQAAVTQATNSAKAAIRSQYAAMGLSGSTMETTALSQVDEQAAAQVFQFGTQLMQTGLSEAELSSQLYESIIGINNTQSATTGQAIANLAAALSSSSKNGNITINTGGGG